MRNKHAVPAKTADASGRPWDGIPAAAPLLRPSKVTEATGIGRTTMYDLISRGLFPPFVKIGDRASAMPAAWLDAYIQAQGARALQGHNA